MFVGEFAKILIQVILIYFNGNILCLLKATSNRILLACHSPTFNCHLIQTTKSSNTIIENVGKQVVT